MYKNTKSIFRFSPQGSEFKRHKSGDFELEFPSRFKGYKALCQNLAHAVNEYLIQKHPGSLADFQGSGMLRAPNDDKSHIYYSVYTTDKNIDKELLKELDVVCRKYLASMFNFAKNQQQDLFAEPSET